MPYIQRPFIDLRMGVSTTGEVGKLSPLHRILTLEIYWGISPVKIRFRPGIESHTFDALFCVHNIWPLPKNSGPNPHFQFLVGGALDSNSHETSGTCLASPVALKQRIRRWIYECNLLQMRLFLINRQLQRDSVRRPQKGNNLANHIALSAWNSSKGL